VRPYRRAYFSNWARERTLLPGKCPLLMYFARVACAMMSFHVRYELIADERTRRRTHVTFVVNSGRDGLTLP
jgi:hypothetical protein